MFRPGAHRGQRGVIATALALAAITAACDDEQPADPTAAEYLADLEAICIETAAELDALPEPPELISVTDFADAASSILAREADRAGALDPPRIDDLDDDHRAFVRNTDDQSAAWAEVASVTAADADADLSSLTTMLGQLALGRDDVAADMGALACQRVAVTSTETSAMTSEGESGTTVNTTAAPGSDS